MKKILLSLFLLFLTTNIAYSAYESPLQEQKLDLKSFTPDELRKIQREKDVDEVRKMEVQTEGEEYMYRMKQQMMQPQGWNAFGGIRY